MVGLTGDPKIFMLNEFTPFGVDSFRDGRGDSARERSGKSGSPLLTSLLHGYFYL